MRRVSGSMKIADQTYLKFCLYYFIVNKMFFFLNKGFLPTIVSLDKTKVCTLASLQG